MLTESGGTYPSFLSNMLIVRDQQENFLAEIEQSIKKRDICTMVEKVVNSQSLARHALESESFWLECVGGHRISDFSDHSPMGPAIVKAGCIVPILSRTSLWIFFLMLDPHVCV
jgi:hypothetical protein